MLLTLLLCCTATSLDQGPPPGDATDSGGTTGGGSDGGASADGGGRGGGDTGYGDGGVEPALSLDQAVYAVGERILATVQGSGEVLLLPADADSEADALYRHNSGTGAAPVRFHPVSLAPGSYEAWLLDAGEVTVSAAFDVVAGSTDPVPPPVEGALTVLSFNTWESASKGEGGTAEVATIIVEAGAEVVALQDCSRTAFGEVAAALASTWPEVHGAEDVRILSRYPIDALLVADVYAYGARLILPDGSPLRVFNTHLTEIPSGLALAAEGATPAEIRTLEAETRYAELSEALDVLVDASGRDEATLLMGTLSAPSHLDWIAGNEDQDFDLVLDWPVSTLLADDGFVDLFRAAWPDPVAVRGFTVSPGAPWGSFSPDTLHERLDQLYARPAPGEAVRVEAAWTMDRQPWPSDHRAVVARLAFEHR